MFMLHGHNMNIHFKVYLFFNYNNEIYEVLGFEPVKQLFSGQALCGTCRDETHRAKMFSQHDVIHMSKKAKELHRKVQNNKSYEFST